MKTVLVTGASKGLGASLIKEFAVNKYNVIITYNTGIDSAEKLKEVVMNYNIDARIIKCDISNERDVINLFKDNKIDILINNAALSKDSELLYKTKKEFMEVLEVNLVGTFLICKEAIKNGVKNIINISSTDSIDTFSSFNVDYSVSKSGINLLTKIIAETYKDIRIFAVLPNWINTESVLEMNSIYLNSELKRIGQDKLLDKDEVAKAIFELYENKNIKSGNLIRIDYEDGLCIKNLG